VIRSFITYSALLLLFSCISQRNVFEIHGKTNGVKNGSWVFFYNVDNDRVWDSAQVSDNSFELSKHNVQLPLNLIIQNSPSMDADGFQYKFFWASQRDIKLSFRSAAFSDIEVSGSDMQNQADELNASLAGYEHRKDSLYELDNGTDIKPLISAINREIAAARLRFVAQHPDYVYCAVMLNDDRSRLGMQELKERYEALDPFVRESFHGKALDAYIHTVRGYQKGDRVEATLLTAFNTTQQVRTSGNGKYLLLNFMASGCYPSREANKQLRDLKRRFGDLVQVCSVSLDKNPEALRSVIREDNITWPVLFDGKGFYGHMAMEYNVDSTPQSWLISPNGVVLDTNASLDQLEAMLASKRKPVSF